MVLHNDIWGDTSVTVIEEIDSWFLIAEKLNMLALYSRLNKEQRKTLQEALAAAPVCNAVDSDTRRPQNGADDSAPCECFDNAEHLCQGI